MLKDKLFIQIELIDEKNGFNDPMDLIGWMDLGLVTMRGLDDVVCYDTDGYAIERNEQGRAYVRSYLESTPYPDEIDEHTPTSAFAKLERTFDEVRKLEVEAFASLDWSVNGWRFGKAEIGCEDKPELFDIVLDTNE